MRRDFVWWSFAAGLLCSLLLAFAPAFAFTQEELAGERALKPIKCENGVCVVDEQDLQFIVQRGRLMEAIANRLFEKVQGCNGGRST